MKNLFTTLGILMMVFFLSSCDMEGPMGPTGPQGPAGSPGINGTSTNEVLYFDVLIGNLDYLSSNASYYAILNLPTTELDALIIYVQLDGEWFALPYLDYFNTTTNFNKFYYSCSEDRTKVFVSIRNSQGLAPFNPMSGTLILNAVIVHGSSPTKKAVIPENIDIRNREQVLDWVSNVKK